MLSKMTINTWTITISDETEQLSPVAIECARNIIRKWESLFTKEVTWVQLNYQIPSLIIRLDCVMNECGVLSIFEVEERPSGLGLTSVGNEVFAAKLQSLASSWPDFYVVTSPRRVAGDDYLWRKELTQDADSNSLVLVRAEPEEKEFYHLEKRSVSSLRSKGCKAYGEGLGLWEKVNSLEFDDLPWGRGFVLKPLQSSKMHDIAIWDPQRRPGSVTRKKIKDTLARHNDMYLQHLIIPPIKNDQYRMYRVFFGYNLIAKEWVYLGGMWLERPNLRLHGATDAVLGPVN